VPVECSTPDVLPSNGTFLGLSVRIAAVAGASVDPADFELLNGDGSTSPLVTSSALACLPDQAAALSGPLAAGAVVTGTVVLDSPATSGTLAFRPGAATAGATWSW
jgi:hypothetical protein